MKMSSRVKIWSNPKYGVAQGSQMPCRVSSDVHEWINEGPTVPAWHPVNPHS